MKFVAGGVRGTAPITHRSYEAYGGDTTSYLVQGDKGDQVVVDLGTGVKNLMGYFNHDAGNQEVTVVITHFHLDHLIGLVTLPNLEKSKTNVTVAARVHGEFEIESVVDNLIKPPYWPLDIRSMSKGVKFENLADTHEGTPRSIGDLAMRWCPQSHPGGSTAYRFDELSTGKSVLVATDIEWQKSTDEMRESFLALCADPGPVDLLVMDGQFQASEYHQREGWGHSTWSDVIEVGKASGAKQVLITHHSPENDDARLDELSASLKESGLMIRLARQGDVINM